VFEPEDPKLTRIYRVQWSRQPRPLSFISSSFSSLTKRSLTKLKTSSTSSFRDDLLVCDATSATGPRSADGNWRSNFLAVFSESNASENVRSGRPVSAHCQITEFVSITRSKNSLEWSKCRNVEIQYVSEGCEWRGTNFFLQPRATRRIEASLGLQKNQNFTSFPAILTHMTWTLLSFACSRTLRHHPWALRVSDFAWKAFVLKVAFFLAIPFKSSWNIGGKNFSRFTQLLAHLKPLTWSNFVLSVIFGARTFDWRVFCHSQHCSLACN
jgi:hypothetical protein